MAALPTEQRQRTSVTEYVEAVLPPDRRDEMLLPLPSQIAPERFMAGLQSALLKNPALMQIHPTLVRNEVIQWVSRGLTFDPYFAEVYLVVRKNFKKQRDEPSALIGVNGLLKLVRQSGLVTSVTTEIVYEHDTFDVSLGLHRDLIHKPELMRDPGPAKFVYAVAHVEGEAVFRVMGMAEVEKHRAASDGWKAFSAGRIKSTPWSEWPEAMAKKTVLRALLKTLPQSSEIAEILKKDDETDYTNDNDESAAPRRGRPPGRLASTLKVIGDNGTTPAPDPKPEPKPEREPRHDDEPDPALDDPELEDEPDGDGEDVAHDAQTGEIIDPPADIANSTDEFDADGIQIDPQDKDFLRGQEDQRNGVRKLLSTSIKNDARRFAHWKAGYDDAEING